MTEDDVARWSKVAYVTIVMAIGFFIISGGIAIMKWAGVF